MSTIKVVRKWAYIHKRPVDNLTVARGTGDTLVCDLRNQLVFIGANGEVLWDNTADFSLLSARVAKSGKFIFVLTMDGYLIKLTREANIEWDVWVERHPQTLAVKGDGIAMAVGSHRVRLNIVNSHGKRMRLLHT